MRSRERPAGMHALGSITPVKTRERQKIKTMEIHVHPQQRRPSLEAVSTPALSPPARTISGAITPTKTARERGT